MSSKTGTRKWSLVLHPSPPLPTEQPEVHFPAPSSEIPCYFQLAMENSGTRTATYPYCVPWEGPRALQTGRLPASFLQLPNYIKYTSFLFGPLLYSFYSNDCTLAPGNKIIRLFISVSSLSSLFISPTSVLGGDSRQPHIWTFPTLR